MTASPASHDKDCGTNLAGDIPRQSFPNQQPGSLCSWGWTRMLFALGLAVLCRSPQSLLYTGVWMLAHWLPAGSLQTSLLEATWKYWETHEKHTFLHHYSSPQTTVAVFDIQQHASHWKDAVIAQEGHDWQSRPLVLKNLWSRLELNNPHRNVSIQGLMRMNETIPYFSDARQRLLTPDLQDRVSDIVRNITRGAPHKIASQLLVEHHPELIHEVAPTHIVTELWGNHFTASHVQGSGWFPATTTVPIFVAHGSQQGTANTTTRDDSEQDTTTSASTPSQPFTALHCEPIGNVAVQLSGCKEWTLVAPEYSHLLRPRLAYDGRAYVVSEQSLNAIQSIATRVTTHAGDALWVPTWTWHRVDYGTSCGDAPLDSVRTPHLDIALGASLFHFRPWDYVRNHPLYAVMIVPAILMELTGYKTQ
jgi:hypothetical protein